MKREFKMVQIASHQLHFRPDGENVIPTVRMKGKEHSLHFSRNAMQELERSILPKNGKRLLTTPERASLMSQLLPRKSGKIGMIVDDSGIVHRSTTKPSLTNPEECDVIVNTLQNMLESEVRGKYNPSTGKYKISLNPETLPVVPGEEIEVKTSLIVDCLTNSKQFENQVLRLVCDNGMRAWKPASKVQLQNPAEILQHFQHRLRAFEVQYLKALKNASAPTAQLSFSEYSFIREWITNWSIVHGMDIGSRDIIEQSGAQEFFDPDTIRKMEHEYRKCGIDSDLFTESSDSIPLSNLKTPFHQWTSVNVLTFLNTHTPETLETEHSRTFGGDEITVSRKGLELQLEKWISDKFLKSQWDLKLSFGNFDTKIDAECEVNFAEVDKKLKALQAIS